MLKQSHARPDPDFESLQRAREGVITTTSIPDVVLHLVAMRAFASYLFEAAAPVIKPILRESRLGNVRPRARPPQTLRSLCTCGLSRSGGRGPRSSNATPW